MSRLDLAITADVLGTVRLRADEIRRSTLVQLAAAWREDPTAVTDVLDSLAEVVHDPHDAEGAEVDAACDDVETVAGMLPASMELRRSDLRQLLDQIVSAYQVTVRPTRSESVVWVPRSESERGAA